MPLPFGFQTMDAMALLLFVVVWVSHYYVINLSRWRVHTITAEMTRMREQWMLNVMGRGESPVDAIIQTGLQQGVLFFASTTVLLIGGLVAGLGAGRRLKALRKEAGIAARIGCQTLHDRPECLFLCTCRVCLVRQCLVVYGSHPVGGSHFVPACISCRVSQAAQGRGALVAMLVQATSI